MRLTVGVEPRVSPFFGVFDGPRRIACPKVTKAKTNHPEGHEKGSHQNQQLLLPKSICPPIDLESYAMIRALAEEKE